MVPARHVRVALADAARGSVLAFQHACVRSAGSAIAHHDGSLRASQQVVHATDGDPRRMRPRAEIRGDFVAEIVGTLLAVSESRYDVEGTSTKKERGCYGT
jgi:hypothetical protein